MTARDHPNPAVIVIGGGVAGLCAARALHERGAALLLLEASDALGGRVRTDDIETDEGVFRLDRGFQVYLDAYPEGRRVLDLGALHLGAFAPGALVRFNGRFHRVADPRRRPLQALGMLRSPIATFGDLWRMGRLDRDLRAGGLESIWREPDRPAIERLRDAGLSEQVIDRFFRPFFGGVFFDRTLQTSARMLRFTYRMFAAGRACLPQGGMQRIAEQVARPLPAASIRTGARAVRIVDGAVSLDTGESIPTGAVIVATDGAAAADLIPTIDPPRWQSTITLHYLADAPPVDEPILLLDGDGAGPVNHLASSTLAARGYATPGRTLLLANIVGDGDGRSDHDLDGAVRRQMTDWFGREVEAWRLLRVDRIPRALPSQFPPALDPPRRDVRLRRGLYVCGDHRDNASINGAMESGRRCAEVVLEDLGLR